MSERTLSESEIAALLAIERSPRPSFEIWDRRSQLPDVAIMAAVEFDWLIQMKQGREIRHFTNRSIVDLGVLLGDPIGRDALYSEVGMHILGRVYNSLNEDSPVRTIEELRVVLVPIAASLKKAHDGADLEERELVFLRKFCLELSKKTSEWLDAVYGSRPRRCRLTA